MHIGPTGNGLKATFEPLAPYECMAAGLVLVLFEPSPASASTHQAKAGCVGKTLQGTKILTSVSCELYSAINHFHPRYS